MCSSDLLDVMLTGNRPWVKISGLPVDVCVCIRMAGLRSEKGSFPRRERQAGKVRMYLEGYSSGQRGQTVNLLAKPSEVRILPPPPLLLPRF